MKKLLIAGLCLAMMLSLASLATLSVGAEEDVVATLVEVETLHAEEPKDDKPTYVITDKFVSVGDGDVKFEAFTSEDFKITYDGSVSQIIGSTGKVEMITGGNGYIIYTTGPNGEMESQYVEGSLSGMFTGPDGSVVRVENANGDLVSENGAEDLVSAFCSLSFAGHSGVVMAAVLGCACLVLINRKKED